MTPNDFREWQFRKGWTNADTARMLGVSLRLVEDMRAGRRRVTLRTQLTMERLDNAAN